MEFFDTMKANRQRMATDDVYVFDLVDRSTNGGGAAMSVPFSVLGGVLGVVRRLRDRVQAQERQIATLEARVAALEARR